MYIITFDYHIQPTMLEVLSKQKVYRKYRYYGNNEEIIDYYDEEI
jgi:hypothetical protein